MYDLGEFQINLKVQIRTKIIYEIFENHDNIFDLNLNERLDIIYQQLSFDNDIDELLESLCEYV